MLVLQVVALIRAFEARLFEFCVGLFRLREGIFLWGFLRVFGRALAPAAEWVESGCDCFAEPEDARLTMLDHRLLLSLVREDAGWSLADTIVHVALDKARPSAQKMTGAVG